MIAATPFPFGFCAGRLQPVRAMPEQVLPVSDVGSGANKLELEPEPHILIYTCLQNAITHAPRLVENALCSPRKIADHCHCARPLKTQEQDLRSLILDPYLDAALLRF